MSAQETTCNTSLPILIDDAFLKVFSFLSLQDRGRAARVCQRWNNLMKAGSLWTWLSFWPIQHSRMPGSAASFLSLWEFPREEGCVLNFLNTYCGISLQTVYLNVVSPGILSFLRKNCPNMKHLSYLPPRKHSFSIPLPTFTVEMGNEYDMAFISRSVTNIQLTFHGRHIPLLLSKKRYFKSKRTRVSILNIADVRYTNALFGHLSKCAHLKHISLYHCSGVSAAALAQLTRSVPYLETLHLMHFDYDYKDPTVLEDILFLVGQNLVVLKSFRYMPMIRKAANVDDFMGIISSRKTLTHLWLPGPMLFFTPRAFADMSRGLRRLEELALCQSSSVTNDVVKMIANYLLQLKELNLRGCNSITDAGIGYLCYNSSLRCLDLRECKRTTTDAALETVLSMSEMVQIDISSHLSKKREVETRVENIERENPNLTVSVDYTYTGN